MSFDDPVKCPECSVWWRGMEHRCQPVTSGIPILPPILSSRGLWPPPEWQRGTITVNTSSAASPQIANVTLLRREDPPDDAVGALVPA
jgi:hypothetical protein